MIELSELQLRYGLRLIKDERKIKLLTRDSITISTISAIDAWEEFILHQIAHAYVTGCQDGMPVAVES